MTRDEMLGRVRSALAGVAIPTLPAPVASESESAGAPLAVAADAPAARAILLERFHDEARAVGTVVRTTPGAAEAGEVLASIVRGATAPRVVTWSSPLVTDVVASARRHVPELVATAAEDPEGRADLAEIGVTSVDALVASSGTLVLGAAGHRHRATSLLPRIHVAVARAEQVVGDLGAAFRAVDASGVAGACLTLITGPSRTADIEKKLVLGVHGPCELHVIIIDDRGSAPDVTADSGPAGGAAGGRDTV